MDVCKKRNNGKSEDGMPFILQADCINVSPTHVYIDFATFNEFFPHSSPVVGVKWNL